MGREGRDGDVLLALLHDAAGDTAATSPDPEGDSPAIDITSEH
ncbi:hypothetical protein [Streptomyces collinus]